MAESTGILRINFDTGDLSEVTGIVQEGTCTLAAITSSKHEGTHGARVTFDGVNDNVSAYQDFTTQTRANVRQYFRLNSTFDGNTGTGVLLSLRNGANIIAYARLVMTAGVAQITRFYRYTDAGSAYTSLSTPQDVSKDTWHYLEIEYQAASAAGANDGYAKLFFDGTEIASATALDNDTITVNRIYLGVPGSTLIPTAGSYIDFDDIKVDSAYIGAYAEEVVGLTPIAHFDFVPNERFSAAKKFGVVAFSKGGIASVVFSINGQGYSGASPISITSMALNEDSGVYEYATELNPVDFSTSGAIMVGAVVTGVDGGTRDLGTRQVYVDKSASEYSHFAYVSADGNNTTGTVDNTELHFLTVASALAALATANGGNVSGCAIMLGAGTWHLGSATITASGEYLTYTKQPGALRSEVIVDGAYTAVTAAFVRFYDLTIQQTNSGSGSWLGSKPTTLWLDHVTVIGAGRHVYPGSTPIIRDRTSYPTYWTDCDISASDYGCNNANLIRNTYIHEVGNDPIVNSDCCINIRIDDVDPGETTYWHADGYQSHTTAPKNRILYGYRATNLHYQGLFVRQPAGDYLDGFAVVNAIFEMREPGRLDQAGGSTVLTAGNIYGRNDHLLVWGCTFVGAHFACYDEPTGEVLSFHNCSFRGNIFERFILNGTGCVIGETPSFALNGNADENEWLDNNYMYNEQESPWFYTYTPDTSVGGDRHLNGVVALNTDTQSPRHLMPTSNSSARGVFQAPPILVDVHLVLRGNPDDVGGIKYVSLALGKRANTMCPLILWQRS